MKELESDFIPNLVWSLVWTALLRLYSIQHCGFNYTTTKVLSVTFMIKLNMTVLVKHPA